MYVRPNFPTKKAVKDAIAAGQVVTVFNPGPFGSPPDTGTATVEGPHYPKPHRWYGEVTIENGRVTSIK
jgi:hypothetical protein